MEPVYDLDQLLDDMVDVYSEMEMKGRSCIYRLNK